MRINGRGLTGFIFLSGGAYNAAVAHLLIACALWLTIPVEAESSWDHILKTNLSREWISKRACESIVAGCTAWCASRGYAQECCDGQRARDGLRNLLVTDHDHRRTLNHVGCLTVLVLWAVLVTEPWRRATADLKRSVPERHEHA